LLTLRPVVCQILDLVIPVSVKPAITCIEVFD
jgi:hypothetical protein